MISFVPPRLRKPLGYALVGADERLRLATTRARALAMEVLMITAFCWRGGRDRGQGRLVVAVRGCDKRRRRLFAAPAAACGPALRPGEAPGFPVRESPGLSAFRPLRPDLRLMIDISVLAVPAV
jgi:hypothetical protein